MALVLANTPLEVKGVVHQAGQVADLPDELLEDYLAKGYVLPLPKPAISEESTIVEAPSGSRKKKATAEPPASAEGGSDA